LPELKKKFKNRGSKWNDGILEKWGKGESSINFKPLNPIIPTFHYSNISVLGGTNA
jgi:hypothetical protein